MMTNQIMTRFLVALCLPWAFITPSHAAPPDADSMRLIGEMRPVVVSVKLGTPLVDQYSLDLLQKGANSSDPAVVAITAWCLGHVRNDSYARIFTILQTRKSELADLAKAFVEIGEAREILRSGSKGAFVAKLEEFDQSKNPYLRIEAAREWNIVDRDRAILKHDNLLNGNRAVEPRLREAVRRSKRKLGVDDSFAPVPFADDRYKVVIDTLFDN